MMAEKMGFRKMKIFAMLCNCKEPYLQITVTQSTQFLVFGFSMAFSVCYLILYANCKGQ